VARLAASQDAVVTDWPEVVAPTAEAALDGLRDRLTDVDLEDATGVGITPPAGAASADSLATAWKLAASSVPPGWWISGLDGFDADSFNPAGWLAFAAGGPDSDYDGKQGIGPTPKQALASLTEELRSRR
jgi:hypothetical protein